MKKLFISLMILFSCSFMFSLNWNFEDDTLTITGNGAMPDFESIRETPWYNVTNSIKKIVIDDGITEIGNNAFAFCYYIEDVTLSNNLKRIGKKAFIRAVTIEHLSFPDTLEVIEEEAFNNCQELETVTFGKNLKTIGNNAFVGTDIEEVTLPAGAEINKDAFKSYCIIHKEGGIKMGGSF